MSRQTPPGTIPTTADNILKAHAVLWLLCQNCDREAKADLGAIVAKGLGHVAVTLEV